MQIRVLNPRKGRTRRNAPRRKLARRRNLAGKEVLNYMKANPKRKRSSSGRFTRRKSPRRSYRSRNPVAVANLQRPRRRRRKAPGPARRKSYRARNRAANPMMRYRSPRRRRNPAMLGDLKSLVVRAGSAIAGGMTTRFLPQALLRESNTGLVGYAANLLTAAVGGSLVARFSKSKDAGDMFLVGGIVMVVGRAVEEYFGRKVVEFAQVGIPLPGLAADYSYDLRLMGDFINQSFPLPYSSLASGRPQVLPSPEAAAAANAGANASLGADPTWSSPWN